VERILAPLIENAVRYASSRVEIGIDRAGSSVVTTIQDDGPGVNAEEQEAIFQPGRRGLGGTTTLSSAGAGLGLALSRRLARTAGGDVQACSSAQGGCFTVTLPSA
jgi:two-component system, OmpR family, sensor kinase